MHYVIDVITCEDRSIFVDSWRDQLANLCQAGGFSRAELFERQRDLRNAHYDYLAVYSWSRPEDYQNGLETGAMFMPTRRSTIERTTCQLEISLSELAEPEDGHVWLINPFEIADAQIQGVLEMWDKAKDYMVTKAGFIDARLFRANSPSSRYGLFNVAHWQSADLFMQALDNKAYDSHREKSQGYNLHPSLCTLVGTVYADANEITVTS